MRNKALTMLRYTMHPNTAVNGLKVHSSIQVTYRSYRQTDVIFMDFANLKAIDKVSHKRLLYKLDFYEIRASTH